MLKGFVSKLTKVSCRWGNETGKLCIKQVEKGIIITLNTFRDLAIRSHSSEQVLMFY